MSVDLNRLQDLSVDRIIQRLEDNHPFQITGPLIRAFEQGRPDGFPGQKWKKLLMVSIRKYADVGHCVMGEKKLREMRDERGRTMAHLCVRQYKVLAQKALEDDAISQLQTAKGFTVAEVGGRRWARVGREILRSPRLYRLPSPDPDGHGPRVTHQMVGLYGSREKVIRQVLQDDKLLELILASRKASFWLHEYFESNDQQGQPGAVFKYMSEEQLTKLLGAEHDKLRKLALRHLGRSPGQSPQGRTR